MSIAPFCEGIVKECSRCGVSGILQSPPGRDSGPVCRPCWFDVFKDASCPFKVGDRIQLGRLRKVPWRVRGVTSDGRYAICTVPFNPQRTVLYTILDFHRDVRGPDNLIFSFGYETDEDIDARISDLENQDIEVTHRSSRYLPLDIITAT
jgi:hypothetical protein